MAEIRKSAEKMYWLIIFISSLRVETWDLTLIVEKLKTKQTKKPKTLKLFSQNQSGCPLSETGAAVELSNFKPFCADCIPKGGNDENQVHWIVRVTV